MVLPLFRKSEFFVIEQKQIRPSHRITGKYAKTSQTIDFSLCDRDVSRRPFFQAEAKKVASEGERGRRPRFTFLARSSLFVLPSSRRVARPTFASYSILSTHPETVSGLKERRQERARGNHTRDGKRFLNPEPTF